MNDVMIIYLSTKIEILTHKGGNVFPVTLGILVGKNVQLNFSENINSGMLQKLYWIYMFWNLQHISYTLK